MGGVRDFEPFDDQPPAAQRQIRLADVDLRTVGGGDGRLKPAFDDTVEKDELQNDESGDNDRGCDDPSLAN